MAERNGHNYEKNQEQNNYFDYNDSAYCNWDSTAGFCRRYE